MSESPPHPACQRIRLIIVDPDESAEVHLSQVDNDDEHELAVLPASGHAPDLADHLPLCAEIEALDVLEFVTDEPVWIANLASRLLPGGTLTIRVPLEGPLAWLDARNLYRYLNDTIGLKKHPEDAKMRNWHRHYREHELVRMLTDAGLRVTSIERDGSPVAEIQALTRSILFQRTPANHTSPGDRIPLGPLSRSITLRATRPKV